MRARRLDAVRRGGDGADGVAAQEPAAGQAGLGVVELQTGNKEKVEAAITSGAQKLAASGADVIILGCAGMTGMQPLVRRACAALGPDYANVAVIDGAIAGMHILAGLARTNYRS